MIMETVEMTGDSNSSPDAKNSLTPTDILALMLLKDFIASRFPSADPVHQVEAAYTFAELMASRRKH